MTIKCDEPEASLPSLEAEYGCPGEHLGALAGLAEDILQGAALSEDGHDHCLARLVVPIRLDVMLVEVDWVAAKA